MGWAVSARFTWTLTAILKERIPHLQGEDKIILNVFIRTFLKLSSFRINLKMTGDMVATTMAWLDDVEAGGATAFTTTTVERLVMPRRYELLQLSKMFWR